MWPRGSFGPRRPVRERVALKWDMWRALLCPELRLDYDRVFHGMTRDELDEALYVADHIIKGK